MKDVYFLSGLGADEEVFSRLNLEGFNVHFIQWAEVAPSDTLRDYAVKLAEQIKTARPVLVGLSFGGIMAIEIAKIIACEKIILISSIKHKKEKPALLRLCAMLGLHRIVPISRLTQPGPVAYRVFGVQRHANLQQLIGKMLLRSNKKFIAWAIHRIVHWKNTDVPPNLVHIHGTHDRLFIPRHMKATHWVERGSHFMVWTHAAEISRLLKKEILQQD